MKMKKTIIALLLTLLTIGNCMSVGAAEATTPVLPVQAEENDITPHAEETVWYERYYNGRWQRRLWSVTYMRWLTDWIDVE